MTSTSPTWVSKPYSNSSVIELEPWAGGARHLDEPLDVLQHVLQLARDLLLDLLGRWRRGTLVATVMRGVSTVGLSWTGMRPAATMALKITTRMTTTATV